MVPIETKLALLGHDDAGHNPAAWGIPADDHGAWFRFLRWSWWRTLDLAALQAWANARFSAADHSDALAEASALSYAIGANDVDLRNP